MTKGRPHPKWHSRRGDALRVADIQKELAGLEVIHGMGRDRFIDDPFVHYTAVRRFEMVGEAAGEVSQDTRGRYPNIPWRKMRGFASLAKHEYWRIDLAQVWIAIESVPELRTEMSKVQVTDVPEDEFRSLRDE